MYLELLEDRISVGERKKMFLQKGHYKIVREIEELGYLIKVKKNLSVVRYEDCKLC